MYYFTTLEQPSTQYTHVGHSLLVDPETCRVDYGSSGSPLLGAENGDVYGIVHHINPNYTGIGGETVVGTSHIYWAQVDLARLEAEKPLVIRRAEQFRNGGR